MDQGRSTLNELAPRQILAGGHGGLGAAELADYRHSQQRIAEMFETAALTIRRRALKLAVEVVGSSSDAHSVLDAARLFEALLKGKGTAEQA